MLRRASLAVAVVAFIACATKSADSGVVEPCQDGTADTSCCVASVRAGDPCSTPDATCDTRCVVDDGGAGSRSRMSCTGGVWTAGHGLFPCDDGGGACASVWSPVSEKSTPCVEPARRVDGICREDGQTKGLYALCAFDPNGAMFYFDVAGGSTMTGDGWTFAPPQNASHFGVPVASTDDQARCDRLMSTETSGPTPAACAGAGAD